MSTASNPSEGASIGDRLKAIAKLSIDKLPVLNTVIERMAAGCAEDFHEYCSPGIQRIREPDRVRQLLGLAGSPIG